MHNPKPPLPPTTCTCTAVEVELGLRCPYCLMQQLRRIPDFV